jgi:hypothetical protein
MMEAARTSETSVNFYQSFTALMMEAARTSETLVNIYQTTRRYNPEDSHLSEAWMFVRVFLCCVVLCK